MTIEAEIERNYAVFKDMLDELLLKAPNQYAVLHNRKLAGIFPTPGEAERRGLEMFGEKPFSVQLISKEPVDLGFFSYASF